MSEEKLSSNLVFIWAFLHDITRVECPFGVLATIPVSYTHLDVYKRQLILSAVYGFIDGKSSIQRSENSFIIDTLICLHHYL